MKTETEEPTAPRLRFTDRRIFVLIALLILIAVTLYSQWNPGGSRARTSIVSSTHVTKKPTHGNDPPFLFSKLKDAHQVFDNERRNLFNFYEPPPPPPPAPSAQTKVAEPAAVCGDQICQGGETYENCPTDCQPPPPPDIGLRYIGYLAEEGGPVVFLTDGKEVYMGRENDIIANKYRILKITDQSVELGYLNLNQSRSIPFQGNNQS